MPHMHELHLIDVVKFVSFCCCCCCRFALFVLKLQGQNALTLATYSGNFDTCQTILRYVDFNECNGTGLLTPLCVAALQGHIAIATVYLRLESSNRHRHNCPSETIHGVCPLRLAQIKGDTNMMELLWPMHQTHVFRSGTN